MVSPWVEREKKESYSLASQIVIAQSISNPKQRHREVDDMAKRRLSEERNDLSTYYKRKWDRTIEKRRGVQLQVITLCSLDIDLHNGTSWPNQLVNLLTSIPSFSLSFCLRRKMARGGMHQPRMQNMGRLSPMSSAFLQIRQRGQHQPNSTGLRKKNKTATLLIYQFNSFHFPSLPQEEHQYVR